MRPIIPTHTALNEHAERRLSVVCSLLLLLCMSYTVTERAIVAVCFSEGKKLLCFSVDCLRIELAVAIQICCEHDTRSFRLKLLLTIKGLSIRILISN